MPHDYRYGLGRPEDRTVVSQVEAKQEKCETTLLQPSSTAFGEI